MVGQFRKVLFWSAGWPAGRSGGQSGGQLGGQVGEMESKAISASNLKLKLIEAELGKRISEMHDIDRLQPIAPIDC